MTHVRHKIRDAAVAALTGLSQTASRVYPGRTRKLAADHQPTLLVYFSTEQSDVNAQGANAILSRNLRVLVEIATVTADVPDETLDAIAAEIETAMATNGALLSITQEVTLVGSTLQVRAEAENHIGSLTLEYRVVYRTREVAPTASV